MPDYGTVAAFEAYHTARGRDTSSYSDPEMEAAKLLASEWIDAVYRSQFMGYKTGNAAQVREWPRIGAYDREGYYVTSDSVPYQIEWATYEATLKELQSAGALVIDYTPSKYQKVRIEGSIDVTYAGVSAIDIQKQFPIIDQILGSLLGHYSTSSLSGRAVRV